MDDELKRFEEKQKLTNLQIDKRFAMLEKSFDELKTGFEKVSVLEDMPKEVTGVEGDVAGLSGEIRQLRADRKKDLEQITALVSSVDVSGIKKDVEDLRKEVSYMRKMFEEEEDTLKLIQNQVLKTDRMEKMHEMAIKIKKIESGFNTMELRLSNIEEKKSTEPIFIE